MAEASIGDEDLHRQLRDELRTAHTDIEAISGELQVILKELEAAAERAKVHLSQGGSAADLASVADAVRLRPALDAGLRRLGNARRRSMTYALQLGAQEGTPLSELARRFGVSRQYVSKVLKEQPPGGRLRRIDPDEQVPK